MKNHLHALPLPLLLTVLCCRRCCFYNGRCYHCQYLSIVLRCCRLCAASYLIRGHCCDVCVVVSSASAAVVTASAAAAGCILLQSLLIASAPHAAIRLSALFCCRRRCADPVLFAVADVPLWVLLLSPPLLRRSCVAADIAVAAAVTML